MYAFLAVEIHACKWLTGRENSKGLSFDLQLIGLVMMHIKLVVGGLNSRIFLCFLALLAVEIAVLRPQ